MSAQLSLLKLQEFDTKIDEAAKRLTIIDSALNDQSQLRKAENLHEAITSKLNSLTSDRKKLERDIEDLSGKMEAANKKIYGGIISSQKELQAAEEEIRTIKESTDIKESQLLQTMLECDRYQAGHNTSEQKLQLIRSEVERETNRLNAEKNDLGEFVSTNTPIRDNAREECNVMDLTVYDRLRKTKKGIAVSVIESDLCSICRVKIPHKNIEDVKSSNHFVHCNSCGRILCID